VIESSVENFPTINWKIHPMRDNLSKGIFFWAVVIMVIWAVYWNVRLSFSPGGSLMFTFAAAFLLLLSLTSFFLQTHYTIDVDGIRVKRWLYKRNFAWNRVRSIMSEKNGVFISPFPVRTRLENFRGVYLVYNDNRENVIEGIRAFLPDLQGLPPAKDVTDK
jgi:hypothetical protein